jgi:NADPH:quinone reductase-like Zn-dependent oxidoreductase
VIGTAGEHSHDRLRDFGAIPVTCGEGLTERVRAIAPNGVDAVIDASGRGEIPDSIELAGGPDRVLTIAAFDAADTGIQLHVSQAGPQEYREILRRIEEGRLRVPIARTYALTETAAALDESRAGHVSGKLVILPE